MMKLAGMSLSSNLFVILFLYTLHNCSAFTFSSRSNVVKNQKRTSLSFLCDGAKIQQFPSAVLFSMDNKVDDEQIDDDVTISENPPVASNLVEKDEDVNKINVPINLPSPILLGSSMVLGIASTGSVFELSSGNPQYGFITTAAIAALGAPLCIFLFYAAIQKGIVETEEDDERFRKGK